MIQQIDLFHSNLYLEEPYHLSYGSITFLDSLWAKISLTNGAVGWGESTPLPGYSDSNMEMVWDSALSIASQWAGRNNEEILSAPPRSCDGFLITALWTALEMASGKILPAEGQVPLVGLVQERPSEVPKEALDRVRSHGYRTFKIKVGHGDVEKSRERINEFQKVLGKGEVIRIDANQSLSLEEALAIASICIPGKVELLEQPLPIGAWKDCSELSSLSPVPIMLDESITDSDSIVKTAELKAADMIKLKWMKQGGWFYLREMLETANQYGLKVILGNGVSGPLNNHQEAAFWLTFLKEFNQAGEMNGFLKLKKKIFKDGLDFKNGSLHLSSASMINIKPSDDDVVKRMTFTA